MEDQKNLIKELKKLIGRKYKVYTSLVHVNQNGTTRNIKLFIVKDGEIMDITWYAGNILDYPLVDKRGDRTIRISGCGMDMGFHLVYSLGRAVYPKGFKSSRRNGINGMKEGDKGYGWDKDGGYRLDHQWI